MARAAVGAQVVENEKVLGFGSGQVQTGRGVGAAAGGSDSNGQAVFGGVVDDRADAPDAAVGCFEFGEVDLPDPVALGGWVTKHFASQYGPRFAVCPKPLGEKQSAAA